MPLHLDNYDLSNLKACTTTIVYGKKIVFSFMLKKTKWKDVDFNCYCWIKYLFRQSKTAKRLEIESASAKLLSSSLFSRMYISKNDGKLAQVASDISNGNTWREACQDKPWNKNPIIPVFLRLLVWLEPVPFLLLVLRIYLLTLRSQVLLLSLFQYLFWLHLFLPLHQSVLFGHSDSSQAPDF